MTARCLVAGDCTRTCAERDDLRAEVTRLRAEIEERTRDNDALRAQLASRTEALQTANGTVAATRPRLALLEADKVSLKNELARTRTELEERTRERDRYKSACIATAREIEDTLGRALFGEQAPAGEAPAWCVYTSEELAVMAAKEIAERTRESVETQAKAIAYPLVLRQSREVLDLLASVRAAAHDGDRTADERIRDVVALLDGGE